MADRKRPRSEDAPARKKSSVPPTGDEMDEEVEDLEFEDPFEDEVEEDDIITEEEAMALEQEEEEDEEKEQVKVWRPNIDQLAEDEVLEYDNNAYDLFHVLRSDWPCLSVDIIPDKLGHQRTKYPHTVYFAAGTQAADPKQNKIFVFKASELHRTRHDDEEDDEEDDYEEDDPVLESRFIKHDGCVNRIRVMPQKPNIIASWSDKPAVNIWDISQDLRCLENPQRTPTTRPLTTFYGHPDEGYALDWSPVSEGRLLSGDCGKFIYLWNPQAGSWTVDKAPFTAHTGSVEDIQWSPSEDNVFASCSVDQTIRIWDIRKKSQSALCVKAHDSDVNVISWNKIASHALLSGADDGSIKAWDLRKFDPESPTAAFTWHRQAITSVAWSPFEGPVLAAASADNQISVWDLSLEADKEEDARIAPDVDIPPQLLFIHQGQSDPKEIRWHPQIPGLIISTGSDGFGVFKTINSYRGNLLTAEECDHLAQVCQGVPCEPSKHCLYLVWVDLKWVKKWTHLHAQAISLPGDRSQFDFFHIQGSSHSVLQGSNDSNQTDSVTDDRSFHDVIPLPVHHSFSFERLDQFLKTSQKSRKNVTLAIINSFSEIVYYNIAEELLLGPGGPPMNQTKLENSENEIEESTGSQNQEENQQIE